VVVCYVGGKFRGPARQSDKKEPTETPASAGPGSSGSLAAIALLGATALCVGYSTLFASGRAAAAPATPAITPAGWHGSFDPSLDWIPHFNGASSQQRGALESDKGVRVQTYSATYATQEPGTELINFSNSIVGDGWSTRTLSRVPRATSDGRTISVASLHARSQFGAEWLIEYVYVVDGSTTPRSWAAQVIYGLRSWTHAAPATIVAVAGPCATTCNATQVALSGYWASWSAAEAR
jgi:hypothetical protein